MGGWGSAQVRASPTWGSAQLEHLSAGFGHCPGQSHGFPALLETFLVLRQEEKVRWEPQRKEGREEEKLSVFIYLFVP